MTNMSGLATIINILLILGTLYVSYKTTIDSVKDEAKWIESEETFAQMTRILRFSMRVDKGEQIRIVLYRFILPALGFIALDTVLKVLSGRSIVSALVFNFLLLGVIFGLFTFMLTVLRDGHLLPAKIHQKLVIDGLSVEKQNDIKIALTHAVETRFSNPDLRQEKLDELNDTLIVTDTWRAETLQHYWQEYGDFVDDAKVRDDMILLDNDVRAFADSVAEEFKALSDDEKHEAYLKAKRRQTRMFIVTTIIIVALNLF